MRAPPRTETTMPTRRLDHHVYDADHDPYETRESLTYSCEEDPLALVRAPGGNVMGLVHLGAAA